MTHAPLLQRTAAPAAPIRRPAPSRAAAPARLPVAEEERAPVDRQSAHSFAQVSVHAAPRPPAEGAPPPPPSTPRPSASARAVLRRACACGGTPGPTGECEACRKKRLGLQRSEAAAGPSVAPPIVHEVLRSHGQPLDAATRAEMEPRFGHSFAQVRVHADGRAAESARAVGAHAYAVGGDIVFAAGRYAPGSRDGRRLIAHELAHVVQQGGAASASLQPKLEVGAVDDPAEREADQAAARVLADASPADLVPVAPRSSGLPRLRRLGDVSRVPPGLPCTVASSSAPPPLVDVRFSQNAATLSAADRAALEAFVVSWRALGGTSPVRVDGYASEEGTDESNWTLSCNRARAVGTELRSPSSGAVPGVPAALVLELAQGETTEFGPRPDNRRARVSSSTAPAPASTTAPTAVPTPQATPTPPPAFLCGPDVSAEIRAAVANTRATFAGWSTTDRTSACDALDSLVTGGFAWDIIELHNNAWILTYRPACATAGATPPCGSSVEVDGECSYAGSPNYVIFGVMCSLCSGHFTAIGSPRAADFTQAGMLRLINLYKGTGFTGLSTPSANFGPSNDWARAGYAGWPAVSSPAGDRPGCSPTCPTPYTGAAFTVRWHPHGVF
jgi:outer membrane protein OmpA-like peptidoglycan-associated protein